MRRCRRWELFIYDSYIIFLYLYNHLSAGENGQSSARKRRRAVFNVWFRLVGHSATSTHTHTGRQTGSYVRVIVDVPPSLLLLFFGNFIFFLKKEEEHLELYVGTCLNIFIVRTHRAVRKRRIHISQHWMCARVQEGHTQWHTLRD